MRIVILLIQVIFIALAAPLASGIIRKLKNNFRMRTGASIFQPYFNLGKFFRKEEVVSQNCSWIFHFAPWVVFAAMFLALFLVPVFNPGVSLNHMGDFLLLVFIMALARFFLSLAALDAAGAFGGMGSSREMFISSLVEPALILSVFTVSLNAGSTDLAAISSGMPLRFSCVIAAAALFMAVIAETGRIPIDNQETHLELTMVHEAMVLEYSGRSLALIEWAAHIKQMIFFLLLAYALPSCAGGVLLKVAVAMVLVAVVEVSLAKMRLFRVVDFLGFAFILSMMSVVVFTLGW